MQMACAMVALAAQVNDMQTTATFIGKDGSMRYNKGETYRISLYVKGNYIWVRSYGHMDCPYETFTGLLKNWRINWQ